VGERNITRQSLIYTELTRIIEGYVEGAILMSARTQQPPLCDPEHNQGVRTMSLAQFRADLTRTMNRRRLYARIYALPDSTVREELLAIAQRHDDND
jgi:pimeloyl-CoA synthetase